MTDMAHSKEYGDSDFANASDEVNLLKHTKDGIALYPQPSDDPKDPLNWSLTKKILMLFIVALAGGIGAAQILALNSGYFIQAELYGKTAVQLSYGASAGIAGLAVGPLFWTPLAQRLGRPSCIFWGSVLTVVCCIWSALMTHPGDYNSFIVSRVFASFFGSAGGALGAGVLYDIFFLHQRGRAFIFYLTASNIGVVLAPTFSGYIITTSPWPVQLWWCVGAEAGVALLAFAFLQETSYPRSSEERFRQRPESFLRNRRVSLLLGTQIVLETDYPKMSPWTAFIIGVCPITILTGILLTVDYGLVVAQTNLLAVFLQSPVEAGGYGFSPAENSNFQFSQWLGIATSMAYGYIFNDRWPLWICKRRGGIWRLEYRLYPALIPAILILPVALGLFGACLQYHLHYMVLAVAICFSTMAVDNISTIVINYLVESFSGYPMETIAITILYRLVLGVAVPFF
ncbi:MAG: hypothetical protein L6R41_002816, partial [Letrouitia leprolyta]